MELTQIVETFARGYCVAKRTGKLWILRDGPRKSGDYRREEFISWGVDPVRLHEQVQQQARGHYCICALHTPEEDGDALRDGFKELGYRLGYTEALMEHPLRRIPKVHVPLPIRRVNSATLADRLTQVARARQMLPEHLAKNASLRCYVALDGERPVGWVSSIATGSATWCANMYVQPEFRRRGIARALMCRMLRDDRRSGSQAGVLTASHAGARLYPVIGYQQVGTLLVLTPKRT